MSLDLHRALAFLASRCDGAHARDGEGFSRYDRDTGLGLAASDPSRWTPGQRAAAHRLATKYRGQLDRAGIEVPPLPAEAPRPAAQNGHASPFEAQLRGEMIALTSDRFPGEAAVGAVKSITGRSFAKTPRPTWWVPRSSAGELLSIVRAGYVSADAETLESLRAIVAGQAEAVQASQRIDAELTIDGLGGTLRPFQRGGVSYLTQHRRCLLADEMGLGKTVQALAALWHLKAFPAVVACPASLKLNWEREARKWLPMLRGVHVVNGKAEAIPNGVGLIVTNYDILAGNLDRLIALRPRALVFDESHYLKSNAAQRTKAARALAAVSGLEAVFLLSGTPVVNFPPDLIAQLEILGRLRELGGWKGFTSRYCIRGHFGGFARGGRDLDRLNTEMRAKGIYIRRLKRDVLKELPGKLPPVVVPMELASRAEYDRVLRSCKERIKAAKVEKRKAAMELRKPEGWAAAASMTAVSELRRAAAKGKLRSAIAWLKDMAESEKLIVFAHHREIVLAVAEAFGAPIVIGGMKPAVKQAAVDRFQNDEDCRAIALNFQAGGVGHTLTASANVIFVERPWTPSDFDQATDRSDRMGQTWPVTPWCLDAPDTIDEWMAGLVAEKRVTVGAATEADEAAMASTIERLASMIEATR